METDLDRALWTIVDKNPYKKQPRDVQQCIKAGANINCQRPIDLHGADGVDVNKRETPLLAAIARYKPKLVKRLLELGADLSAATGAYGERTVLHIAALHDRAEIAGILVDAGMSMEYPDTVYGWTALHLAVYQARRRHETVRMLLAKGANVNATDDMGRTPLHIALEYGGRFRQQLLEILLAGGADLSAKTFDGKYPDASYPLCKQDYLHNTDTRWIKTLLDKERLRRCEGGLAFAMGQHERLGAQSWVQYLEPDVVRMVMQYV